MMTKTHKKYESVDADLDPWQRLANAIVLQAAKEYLMLCRAGSNAPDSLETFRKTKKLEMFFRSQWYEALTEADGNYIIDRIKREV